MTQTKETHKLGPLLLSGLMIGPILGSGVVLLPPLAVDALGSKAWLAWLIIMALGAIFAYIFSALTVMYPGEGGMTLAVEKVLGTKAQLMSALFMLAAVSFGPAAVMLTAAGYLRPWLAGFINTQSSGLSQGQLEIVLAGVLVIVAHVLLRRRIKILSTLSLVLSAAIGLILTLSAAIWLWRHGIQLDMPSVGDIASFGKTTMLLFWAIIGWEIVGNYALSVRDLKKTVPRATHISLIAVTLIYLSIALAVQSSPGEGFERLLAVIQDSFGAYATTILAILVLGLCLSTYLLIVGAIIRLTKDLSERGWLPSVFKTLKGETPIAGLYWYSSSHLLVLLLVFSGLLKLEWLVGMANGFFLANALLGVVAASQVLKSNWLKIGSYVLMICLVLLLLFSSPLSWLGILGVALVSHRLVRKGGSNGSA